MVHVVDVSGSEGRDPKEDFRIINEELEKFNPELAQRPMLVAGNKCDLTDDEAVEAFRAYIEELGYAFFPIMAPIRHGVDELLNAVSERLSKLPPILRFEPEPEPLAPESAGRREPVQVTEENGVYFAKAPWLEKALSTIDLADSESLQYMQRLLIQSGVIDALREAGVQEGDTVDLYGVEFDFVE